MSSNHWFAAARPLRAGRDNIQRGDSRPIVEPLEDRRLMFGDGGAVQPLPFTLDFDGVRGGVADQAGLGTGFTWVSPAKDGTEYQPGLINLRTSAGLLDLTTAGNSTFGSNWEDDNTLANSLQVQFNAGGGTFTIIARIKGPLALNELSEQAGIVFGPDQDNYVKLIALWQPNGEFLQFADEHKTDAGYEHTLSGDASLASIGAFSSITSLDLEIAGDPATGKLTAFYRRNGGAVTAIKEITLAGERKERFFSAAARAGVMAMHKNDTGPIKVSYDRFQLVKGTPTTSLPKVTNTNPPAGATGVFRDAALDADVSLPNANIDAGTLDSTTVKLYRTSDGQPVVASVFTSGGGDTINLHPLELLAANTNYTFEITSGVRDNAGVGFVPHTITFTTGTAVTPVNQEIKFAKTALPTTQGNQYTGVTIGPDGKLYAGASDGKIHRFTIASNGTLSAPQVIATIQTANGGPRLLTGITFDPASTASNLVLWVTHGQHTDLHEDTATDWTGKVSRLSGANLQAYQDYVTGLPRSVRDHLTNQIAFGPDKALYFCQGSNSAMGAPDTAWGFRPERLLTGAVLRLDTGKVATRIAGGQGPLDAKTEADGNYNPFAAGAALTIYASGVRNAYDLLWHSNGSLYAPTNGSAAGANTPASSNTGRRIDNGGNAYAGPSVPGLNDVPATQNDFMFRIAQGGYYGQPNPTRGEFVLNGGNPTAGSDKNEVTAYPVGTKADVNYRGSVYNFGKKQSPDGIIEYRSGQSGGTKAFGGALEKKMLVARFSTGKDILVLDPGADGNVVDAPETTVEGLTGFADPLDLCVDPRTGFIYVVEYSEHDASQRRITLLKPVNTTPPPPVDTTAPAVPWNVSGEGRSDGVRLAWAANRESDLDGYRVFRSTSSRTGWQALAGGQLLKSNTYVDSTTGPGVQYFYRVSAVDKTGNASAMTFPPIAARRPAGATVRINAGGSALTDFSGRTWAADFGFAGGAASTAAYDVQNTTNDGLYAARRFGNFQYALPATDGAYVVTLHFADPVHTEPDRRKFDVFAEGALILDDLDLAANGGGKAALTRTVTVNVTGGTLDLQFASVLDNALVSAIEFERAG